MKELYTIILYSIEDKAKIIKTDLTLDEAREYMLNHKTQKNTMLGLIPNEK